MADNDGCKGDCNSVEATYTCDVDKDGKSVCELTTCGNGLVEASETCDDGSNGNNDTGCNTGCLTGAMPGYVCGGGSASIADKCEVCGDGKQTTEYSKCDDGNSKEGDGCSSVC